jgi:hypothetical protein
MIILELCSGGGTWSEPYLKAGYDVRRYELKNGDDVRLIQHINEPIQGILAGPPCTHFARSGARWWEEKGESALLEGLAVVDACMRIIAIHKPKWWALENPVGRLTRYLGKPRLVFQPCDYGDPYTKRTCLWGDFTIPVKTPVEATEGSKMWLMGESKARAALRSVTPPGFAQAFFNANP